MKGGYINVRESASSSEDCMQTRIIDDLHLDQGRVYLEHPTHRYFRLLPINSLSFDHPRDL